MIPIGIWGSGLLRFPGDAWTCIVFWRFPAPQFGANTRHMYFKFGIKRCDER
jgi:hypothetical protein